MRGCSHWKVACLTPFSNLIHESGGVAKHVNEVDAVAHERTFLHHLAKGTGGWSAAPKQQARDGGAVAQHERACRDHDRLAG